MRQSVRHLLPLAGLLVALLLPAGAAAAGGMAGMDHGSGSGMSGMDHGSGSGMSGMDHGSGSGSGMSGMDHGSGSGSGMSEMDHGSHGAAPPRERPRLLAFGIFGLVNVLVLATAAVVRRRQRLLATQKAVARRR